MKRNFSIKKSCLAVAIMGALALGTAFAAILLWRGVQRTRAVANVSPSIIVNAPADGEIVPAGSPVLAHVSAVAQNPVARLELWLDGVLVETLKPDPAQREATTFHAISELHIEVGLHLFFARTVDSRGLVGQSNPITIQGSPAPETVEITVGEGQTVEDIASTQGSDLETIIALNPNLQDNNPPTGTNITIPAPGGSAPLQDSAPPPTSSPVIIPPAPLPIIPANLPPLQPNNTPMMPISLPVGAPKAPTFLKAGYENCTVRLAWTDNADNEALFNVWMQALGGPPKVIASLKGSPQTGPAWYEFAAPISGIYSFWIEAVNALGRQPSEIQWVGVTDLNCSPGVATHLTVETVDMQVSGGYDRVYCYLSVEGMPEKRIPTNDNLFVQVQGIWGDISNWTGSGNSFLLPEPLDGEVTLEGKCLGWTGGSGPDNLGIFKASVPKTQWDGSRLELKGQAYIIGIRIQPHGAVRASGFYTYTDFTIPVPSVPWVTTEKSPDPNENDKLARRPTLHWIWSGDTSKLTGFTIFLDGKFFRSVPNWQGGAPGNWDEMILLPTSCGGTYKFQVAANSGEAQSVPSVIYEYRQPPCERYVEVTFESVDFMFIADGETFPLFVNQLPCHVAETRFYLIVNNQSRFFGFRDIKGCAKYTFSQLIYAGSQKQVIDRPDTFIVPIPSKATTLSVGVHMIDRDLIGDDTICYIKKDNMILPDELWTQPGHIVTTETRFSHRDASGDVIFSVKGFNGPPVNP
jgi:hypothetical protein